MNRGTALLWRGAGLGTAYWQPEAGVSIVAEIPPVSAYQFSFEITEDFIQALRDGKFIEIRVGSLGTNEYQAYLSFATKKD